MSLPELPPRFFALLPAAGESQRMGCAKLLLPWRGKPLLEHVCNAWRKGGVDTVVVVVRPHDTALAELAAELKVIVVQPPQSPPDMKASIQYALAELAQRFATQVGDAWLVAPADSPRLSADVITRLLAMYEPTRGEALVPIVGDRRGHPALIPWGWRTRLDSLEPQAGLNQLLRCAETRLIDCSDLATVEIFQDLDTPEDYRRLCEQEG